MTAAVTAGQLREFVTQTTTLGHLGEQHELDTAVVCLASQASSYVIGVTLAVGGGMWWH